MRKGMASAWQLHEKFQLFLSLTREHNQLLTNRLVGAATEAIRLRDPRADLRACEALLEFQRELRVELFTRAHGALSEFATATRGAVSASQIDEALELLQTERFVVRLLSHPLGLSFVHPRVSRAEWGGRAKTRSLWLVMASDDGLLRRDAALFGYNWDLASHRALARRDLDSAGYAYAGRSSA